MLSGKFLIKQGSGRISSGYLEGRDSCVRKWVLSVLETAFSEVPDKTQAWHNLISLTQTKDCIVKKRAAEALQAAFGQVPDKTQAWQDLVILAKDEDIMIVVCRRVPQMLWRRLSFKSPTERGSRDLIELLTQCKNSYVQRSAAIIMETALRQVPSKEAAWQDLLKLTEGDGRNVRLNAVYVLKKVFSQIPDRALAWQAFIRLTADGDV